MGLELKKTVMFFIFNEQKRFRIDLGEKTLQDTMLSINNEGAGEPCGGFTEKMTK